MSEENEKEVVSSPQSFIIKLWLEKEAETNAQSTWQGSLTHIPSGARRSFRRLDEIAGFIQLYLPDTSKAPHRLRDCWECLKRCCKR